MPCCSPWFTPLAIKKRRLNTFKPIKPRTELSAEQGKVRVTASTLPQGRCATSQLALRGTRGWGARRNGPERWGAELECPLESNINQTRVSPPGARSR